jgi:hypothetical protein
VNLGYLPERGKGGGSIFRLKGEKVTDLFSDYERVRKCIGHLFALRNPLNAKTYGLCLLAILLQVTACSANEDAGVSAPTNNNAYFPLAVGNKWEYGCSVEGEHAFDKVLTITAIEMIGGNKLYRGKLQADDGGDPLVQYYSVDGKGIAYSSLEKSNKDKALIISANPKDGEHKWPVRQEGKKDRHSGPWSGYCNTGRELRI